MPDTDALLEEIEDERARLGVMLSGVGEAHEASLAMRPPSGKWSVLENVRHLLFAEQLHLGRYAPELRWSALGFTPETMRAQRKLPPVEEATSPSIAAVLAAWDEVHLATVAGIAAAESSDGGDEVRAALTRNLTHLRAHVNVIERLLH